MACTHAESVWVSMKHRWCHTCEALFCVGQDGALTSTPLSLSTKLDVFESRQHGWFFAPIRETLKLHGPTPILVHRRSTRSLWQRLLMRPAPVPKLVPLPIPVGEFVALNSLLAYFEGIEQFRGMTRAKNGDRFKTGTSRVLTALGVTAADVDDLWTAVRNPLSHEGMTYSMVTIANGHSPDKRLPLWRGVDGRLCIDPTALLAAEVGDFDAYVAALRSGANATLVSAFESLWDEYWERS